MPVTMVTGAVFIYHEDSGKDTVYLFIPDFNTDAHCVHVGLFHGKSTGHSQCEAVLTASHSLNDITAHLVLLYNPG